MPNKNTVRQKRRQAQQQKQKRGLFIIGGVVLLAVVAVAVLIFSNNTPVAEGSYVTVEPKEWPQADGKALGPADAPVVVREFSDFQCPYCRQFHQSIQDTIVDEYVSTGQVRFEYRHFIVIDGNVGGNESRQAAEASECAAEQGKFWDYHKMLFANQQGEGVGSYTDARLKQFAAAIGLDTDEFNSCYNSNRNANNITNDELMARQLQVSGTPALFVNNKKVANPLDPAQVKAAIDEALNSANQ
jgi:protein-disulfide isomerase